MSGISILYFRNLGVSNLKKIFLLCNCIIALSSVFSQGTDSKKMKFQGYSGGMMLHTGYLFGGDLYLYDSSKPIKIQGVPFGIGGAIRFCFGEHLRIGIEGYSSNLMYGEKNNSFLSLGWGGVLIDCQWKIKKTSIFCGGTFGGGGVKNIAVVGNDLINPLEANAVYRKYGVIVITPFVGMEYAMSTKIHLIIKVDCITNLTKKQSDFVIGPRIYIGFNFSHVK